MVKLRFLVVVTCVAAALLVPTAASATAVPFFDESAPASADYAGTGAIPLVGDFNGDGTDDLFLYRPGSASETVKFGQTDRTFVTSTASHFQVRGTYQPLVGDFDGNGITDIFWYAPGSAPDYLWLFTSAGPISVPKPVNGTYQPILGDFVRAPGDPNATDIFWYAPGRAPDYLWHATGGGSFTSINQSVKGTYIPLVGGFTPEVGPTYGGSVDLSVDIFWYAPGSAPDSLWDGNNDGTWNKIPKAVTGTYQPFVGLFDGYGVDDIFWYSQTGSDYVWLGDPDTGAQNSYAAPIDGGYIPVHGLFRIPDEPILWWSPTGPDQMWFPQGVPGVWDYSSSDLNTDMGAGYQPQTGDFDGNGHNDIYWLKQGPGAERMFWGRSS